MAEEGTLAGRSIESDHPSKAVYLAYLKDGSIPREWPPRLARLVDRLACPRCNGTLAESTHHFRCEQCSANYPIQSNKIYFIEPFGAHDPLDGIKSRLKKALGKSYYTIGKTLLAPTYPFNYRRAIEKRVSPAQLAVVDVGSGNHRIHDEIVTLDGTDYAAVDIVADLAALPFRSGSLDALCSSSALEHVAELGQTLREIDRCTKPRGLGIHFTPFLFPLHASPHDYMRFTHAGAARLFPDWHVVEQRGTSGPVTLFLGSELINFSALTIRS